MSLFFAIVDAGPDAARRTIDLVSGGAIGGVFWGSLYARTFGNPSLAAARRPADPLEPARM
ncbi:hypothetical protein [Pinisolibacter aquiterrae]|uniref:hypothetical protein n=1 Tax=Pinisolibacter aquiterrae TaxID=2815579 RepID=UPI001C3E5D3B|nr:hypothetical protein [Pinisolibacter aquiterrae]MBV5263802.1 hypothetical protein [Pinisolibacter aquiterrae]MCC8237302.1 hypothetical protein [Pinisolibacter aquiterrae]